MMTPPHPPHVLVANAPQAWLHISGVLGLAALAIVVAVWYARRARIQGHGMIRKAPFNVTYSQSLGPRERLVVVEMGEQQLLLGVTAQQITCLQHRKTAAPAAEVPAVGTPGGHFRTILLNCLSHRRERGNQ